MSDLYYETVAFYPEETTDFLPTLRQGYLRSYRVAAPKGRFVSFIHLVMKYPDKRMGGIVENLPNTLATYKIDDLDKLLLIDSGPVKFYKNKDYADSDSLIPLPDLSFIDQYLQRKSFVEQAQIRILGYGNNSLYESGYNADNLKDIPEGWERGYTYGVILWRGYIVYWFDAW